MQLMYRKENIFSVAVSGSIWYHRYDRQLFNK